MAERLARRSTEDALAEALGGRLEAEGQLQRAIAAEHAGSPSRRRVGDAKRTRQKVSAGLKTDAEHHVTGTTALERKKKTNGPAIVDDGVRLIRGASQRGRPAVAGEQESKIVKWWKPRSMGGAVQKRGRGRPKGSKNRPKP